MDKKFGYLAITAIFSVLLFGSAQGYSIDAGRISDLNKILNTNIGTILYEILI